VTVGALGDSYTDEYRSYTPDRSQARNWVEILSASHLASFGAFSNASRGEPRNAGFLFNWARSDATSSDVIARQLRGLAGQVAKGQVQYSWVFMGGNDFLFFLRHAAETFQFQGPTVTAQLRQVEARAEANFNTAVKTLLTANPRARLVVATVPDIRALPIIKAAVGAFPQAASLIAATSQQIERYNAQIRRVAKGSSRIALADLASATSALTNAPASSAPFGGVTIDLRSPGNDYHHFFLADGIHVGTVGQGIIADTFVAAVNARFGARLGSLSQSQIVQFARRVGPSVP
jgi:lysophospholipase L1-like esterase